jgi:two-component system, response regulator PdtaR
MGGAALVASALVRVNCVMSVVGKRAVLIVEDDALVRVIGSDALEDAGYEVLEAASADEALSLLDANDNVRLLFTDIRMPGKLDGLQLADLVHERWPTIKILITSGDTWPSQDRIPDDGQFIAKPYKVSALCDQVDRIIGE